MNEKIIWNADVYLRLSKEDGDKEADGYTGSDFMRPAFEEMMDNVRKGVANCVIVKDLSRFGRDYITAGDYIEKIFPSLGVRFISITDNIDTKNARTASDAILIPFKNLINDAYCRDISTKIRRQFDSKRRHGEFIGSFATYGYRKDPENKNKLLIDDAAAEVVRKIYRMKLGGWSADAIAKKLNSIGVLSPMKYKQANGMAFFTSFRTGVVAQWKALTVSRILKNDIYIGTLTQGRVGTPNHKVKQRIQKSPEQWAVVKNNHAPIIDEAEFSTVQKVLSLDIRISPNRESVYLLSGIVYCGVCGESMVRKMVPSGNKNFAYFICSKKKKDGSCTSHSISAEKVECYVLDVLKQYVLSLVELEEVVRSVDEKPFLSARLLSIQSLITRKEEEIEQYRRYKKSLYESYLKKIITQDDFKNYSIDYDLKIKSAEEQCQNNKLEAEKYLDSRSGKADWLKNLEQYRGVFCFTRDVIIRLIDLINIFENGELEVCFRFQSEYDTTVELVKLAQKEYQNVITAKEAI